MFTSNEHGAWPGRSQKRTVNHDGAAERRRRHRRGAPFTGYGAARLFWQPCTLLYEDFIPEITKTKKRTNNTSYRYYIQTFSHLTHSSIYRNIAFNFHKIVSFIISLSHLFHWPGNYIAYTIELCINFVAAASLHAQSHTQNEAKILHASINSI